jgi:hypothetical protein
MSTNNSTSYFLGYKAGAYSAEWGGPYFVPDFANTSAEFDFDDGFCEGFSDTLDQQLKHERVEIDSIHAESLAVLNQFPADFIQVPDFEFPTTSGVPGNVHLGILPSRSLLIASECGLILSGSYFLDLVSHAIQVYQLDQSNLVLIFHSRDEFKLVEFYFSDIPILRAVKYSRLIHLFHAPGPELTPAHLRQLVGMLPAIREVMAEGQGGVE